MAKVRKAPEMSPQALQAAAECLRTLAHPQRLQIVRQLLGGNPITAESATDVRAFEADAAVRIPQERATGAGSLLRGMRAASGKVYGLY